jgi:hypothetical protein
MGRYAARLGRYAARLGRLRGEVAPLARRGLGRFAAEVWAACAAEVWAACAADSLFDKFFINFY